LEKQFDILSIGECLVEFTREEGDRYIQSFAGDVYNTLFYSSRLGLKTKFLSCFGGDQFTNGIIKLSGDENIDVSNCKILQDRVNGLYTVDKDENGRPLFSFWRKNSAATQTLVELGDEEVIRKILDSQVFLFSFIPIVILHESRRLFRILEEVKGKTLIYFDTNIRRSLWHNHAEARLALALMAEYIDVISVSKDDHNFLTSGEDHLTSYSEIGYKKILFRDESKPVKYLFDGVEGEVPTYQATDIVDMTGAGDAFNAGCIYGMLNGYATEDAIRLANASAAVALTGRGGMAKNYSRSEVEKLYGAL
jgi:2-dehydro-3-deoxygluconokinase